MPDSPVEEIKSKLNIVDVVADYVQLKKAGVNFRARCPFHGEKTPSFYVSPVRQIWHCFGCGLGGDIFEFVKQIESVDFGGALEKLADRAGVVLQSRPRSPATPPDKKEILFGLNDLAARFYHKVLLESPIAQEARDYLAKRKFAGKTLKSWVIGYAPDRWDALYQFLKKKNYQDADIEAAGLAVRRDGGGYFDRFRDRIMFPIRDLSGRTVGFAGRILHPNEGTGKYVNSPESPIYSKSQVLFGLFEARTEIRKKNLAVIVEGNIDVIKSHQAGVVNVIASSGTALAGQQLTKLSRLAENLTFAFDADQAGAAAARRALDPAIESGFNVRIITPVEGSKDADEIIDRDPSLWNTAIEGAQTFLDFYFHKLFDILDKSDALAKKRAIEEFVSLLALVPNPVVAGHYVHEASKFAGVKEQVIADMLFGKTKKPPGRPGAPAPAKPVSSVSLVQQRFLGLLLGDEKMARFYAARHSPEDFAEEKYRRMFSDLSSFFKNSESGGLEEFFSICPQYSQEAQQAAFAAELGAEENETPGAELRELSKRLRITYLENRAEALAGQISEAERGNDPEAKNRLMVEYNNIQRRKQNIENDNWQEE